MPTAASQVASPEGSTAPPTVPAWHAPSRLADLDRELGAIFRDSELAGAAAALVDETGAVWIGTYGVADRATERPLGADTPLRWGSISKSLTAVAAMMLVEEGVLDLDAPLATVAPDVPFENPHEATHPVRVGHLLEHTAGWDDVPFAEFASDSPNFPVAEYARSATPDRYSHWVPGQAFRYANGGPAVLGYVIERLSGRPFDDFVRERVLEPLGMSSVGFATDAAILARLSRSYPRGSSIPDSYWHMRIRPSGAAHGTIGDLAAFTAWMIRRGELPDGRALLRPGAIERLERMEYSAAARAGVGVGYSKGQFHWLGAARIWHGHWGKVDGFRAAYGYLPEHGRGFALIVNTLDGDARQRMLTRLAEAAAEGLPDALPPSTSAGAAAFDEAFAGWYVTTAPEREITRLPESLVAALRIESRGGSVLVTSRLRGLNDTYELLPGGLLRLAAADAPSARLAEEGGVRIFTAGARFEQRAAPTHLLLLGVSAAGLLVFATSLLHAPFWITAALRGRHSVRGALLRAAPLVAAAAAVTVLYLVIGDLLLGDGEGRFTRYGEITGWSSAVFAASVLFPVAAAAGAALALTARPGESRIIRTYSAVASVALLASAAYWASQGWIGLRTWHG